MISNLTCAAANELARSEHGEIVRAKHLTKAVLCDVQPFCATEVLFNHEFYWKETHGKAKANAPKPVSRCRSWKTDGEWPGPEPHLKRSSARTRSFWDVMRLLPNRTLWLHGDSIQLQLCDAALCSLMRAGVASTPVLDGAQTYPLWLRKLSDTSAYNFITTTLPNGARLLCSGIGPFQRAPVEKVLAHVEVAVLNFGLHYHILQDFREMLEDAVASLGSWQQAAPHRRLALWREGSAQVTSLIAMNCDEMR